MAAFLKGTLILYQKTRFLACLVKIFMVNSFFNLSKDVLRF